MKGAVLYGRRDIRYVEREEPKIVAPTDVILRISATCVCGSDLWPYRGIDAPAVPTPMGHEYCGIVEEVGAGVKSIRRGQFVVGSFFASDNTCEICHAGYQSRCAHVEYVGAGGAQAPLLRVPLAGGTRASSLPRTCWAPGGSPPTLRTSGPARLSPLSATARWVYARCSPRSNWVPSASLR